MLQSLWPTSGQIFGALPIFAVQGFLLCAILSLIQLQTVASFQERANFIWSIAEKEGLIELFREERQAIINHAVTKGIQSGVKMKPSGVE